MWQHQQQQKKGGGGGAEGGVREFASTSVAVVGFREIGLQNQKCNADGWLNVSDFMRWGFPDRGDCMQIYDFTESSCPLPSVYLKIEMIVQELSEDKWTNTECSPH